jgi:glycosyltransferase involved in cell wall biosynthesis
MKAFHQFTAGFARGDAISNCARALQSLFRSWGWTSHLYSEASRIHPDFRHEVRDVSLARRECGPRDGVLLHLSIGSTVNRIFREWPGPKVILYHNVTPPEYFARLQPETAAHLRRGREEAAALAGTADLNLAVSRFNAQELEGMGYRHVRVMPLYFGPARLTGPADQGVIRRYRDGKAVVLFVGRCAPNKKIEDLITAFAFFQKTVEPASRLIVLGSWIGLERYYHLLQAQVAELELRDVIFTGPVPSDHLYAAYRAADLFLCLSEHEGFCIPLLEAMAHDVPVIARAVAAIPETMDGAGVLVAGEDYPELAELMGRVIRPGSLREAILKGQRDRLTRYFARDLESEWRTLLEPLLAGAEHGR